VLDVFGTGYADSRVPDGDAVIESSLLAARQIRTERNSQPAPVKVSVPNLAQHHVLPAPPATTPQRNKHNILRRYHGTIIVEKKKYSVLSYYGVNYNGSVFPAATPGCILVMQFAYNKASEWTPAQYTITESKTQGKSQVPNPPRSDQPSRMPEVRPLSQMCKSA